MGTFPTLSPICHCVGPSIVKSFINPNESPPHPQSLHWQVSVVPSLAISHAGVACQCAFKGELHLLWRSVSCMPVKSVRLLPPQRQDASIYNQHCSAGDLHAYAQFKHLLTRKLVSPIPDSSRDGETGFLTPLIDWKSVTEASRHSNCPSERLHLSAHIWRTWLPNSTRLGLPAI